MEVKEIKINTIHWDENSRVRDVEKNISELMQSIKQHGLEQPIGICIKKGRTQGIFGFRRYTACKKLGWNTIPCNILDNTMSSAQMLLMNTVENIQRKDITPNELGRMVDMLVRKHNMTFSEVAARLDISTARIKSAFEMYTELPENIRNKVVYSEAGTRLRKGQIPANMAHRLLQVKKEVGLSKQKFSQIANKCKEDGFSREKLTIAMRAIKNGMSTLKALSGADKYKNFRINLIISKKLAEKMEQKYNMSVNALALKILYGQIKAKFDKVE